MDIAFDSLMFTSNTNLGKCCLWMWTWLLYFDQVCFISSRTVAFSWQMNLTSVATLWVNGFCATLVTSSVYHLSTLTRPSLSTQQPVTFKTLPVIPATVCPYLQAAHPLTRQCPCRTLELLRWCCRDQVQVLVVAAAVAVQVAEWASVLASTHILACTMGMAHQCFPMGAPCPLHPSVHSMCHQAETTAPPATTALPQSHPSRPPSHHHGLQVPSLPPTPSQTCNSDFDIFSCLMSGWRTHWAICLRVSLSHADWHLNKQCRRHLLTSPSSWYPNMP